MSVTPHFIIEHCFNCKEHQWCTRHKEDKYVGEAKKIVALLEKELGAGCVLRNEINIGLLQNCSVTTKEKTVDYEVSPHMDALGERILEMPQPGGNIAKLGNFLLGAFEIYFMGVRLYSKK